MYGLCLTVLAVLGIFSPSQLMAQGTLQFNQVINATVTGTTSGASQTQIGTIVVPAGKVLKIESLSLTWLNTSPAGGSGEYAKIDNLVVYAALLTPEPHFPIWLKEGTHNVYAKRGNSLQAEVSYSAIEFNVIP